MYKNIQNLLRKMILGNATESEENEIKEWFADRNAEQTTDKEELLKNEMWQRISMEMVPEEQADVRVIPLYRKLIPYAAAASLLIGLSGSAYFVACRTGAFSTEISLDNSGHNTLKQLQSSGIDLALLSDSKVNMTTNLCGTKSMINFCGNIEIKNHGGQSIQAEISSSCANSPYTITQRKLEEGKEYLLFHRKFKFEEVYVIDKESVEDLPPVLKSKVEKIFKI